MNGVEHNHGYQFTLHQLLGGADRLAVLRTPLAGGEYYLFQSQRPQRRNLSAPRRSSNRWPLPSRLCRQLSSPQKTIPRQGNCPLVWRPALILSLRQLRTTPPGQEHQTALQPVKTPTGCPKTLQSTKLPLRRLRLPGKPISNTYHKACPPHRIKHMRQLLLQL